jgi:branched-chain amino acid transport system substrate-binding protein
MHLIYEALKKTNGDANGDKILAAMKGASWTSVRGPMTIDAETRDVIQDIYIRKSDEVDGQMWNVEFDKIAQFKDPGV